MPNRLKHLKAATQIFELYKQTRNKERKKKKRKKEKKKERKKERKKENQQKNLCGFQ